MKLVLLFACCAMLFSTPAFALGKVQFDIEVSISVCAVKDDGASCYESDPQIHQFHETLVADQAESTPDGVAIAKTYNLTSPYNNDASMQVLVDFYQIKLLGPDTTMHIQLLPVGSDPAFHRVEPHETYVSANDLSTLDHVACEGPTTLHTMANGAKMAIVPQVIISKIKVLK